MIRLTMVLFVTVSAVAGALPTTIALQSSTNSAIFGHPVILTATVSPSAALGSVTFYDGTSILGTSMLGGGRATLTTIFLPSGNRSLRAFYGGDNSYESGTSPTVALRVTALAGTGFQPVVNYPAATNSAFVATGDFNGDGRSDLVIANATMNPGQVLLMLGNGDGTFKTPLAYAAGGGPSSIVVGDFNGDGRADLAVTNSTDNNVSVLLGNGDGTFQPAFYYTTDVSPVGIAVGDLNGDGAADLVVATMNGISVLLGVGDGTFRSAANYGQGMATAVAVADFNGDGRPDVVIASSSGISVMLGIGDGTFQNRVNYTTGVGGGPVVVGDFNGDGRMDIAAAAGASVSVVLGNGDGTFQKPILSVSGAANAFIQTLAVGDFNGDGQADLVIANYSGSPSGTNVSVLLGNGNGSFQTPVFYNVTAVTFAAVGDFNGDGVADVVTAGLGPVGVLLGIPAIVNPPPPPPPPPTVSVSGVLNGASFAKDASGNGTAVAPGSLVSIFGMFPGAVQADAATVPFGASLGQVSVTIGGIAAPIRDVVPAASQINAQVPFEVPSGVQAGSSPINVVVTVKGIPSAPVAVPVGSAAPGIFTLPPTGVANAILVFVDPTDGVAKIAAPVASSASIGLRTAPIPRGQAGYFYATGLGAMTPPVADGNGGLEPPVETHFATNPIVLIGGITASVAFAGQAPGFPGVNQINIVVPNGAPTGDAVPIQIRTPDGTIVSNTAIIAIR